MKAISVCLLSIAMVSCIADRQGDAESLWREYWKSDRAPAGWVPSKDLGVSPQNELSKAIDLGEDPEQILGPYYRRDKENIYLGYRMDVFYIQKFDVRNYSLVSSGFFDFEGNTVENPHPRRK